MKLEKGRKNTLLKVQCILKHTSSKLMCWQNPSHAVNANKIPNQSHAVNGIRYHYWRFHIPTPIICNLSSSRHLKKCIAFTETGSYFPKFKAKSNYLENDNLKYPDE